MSPRLIIDYIALYRIDAALIAFVSYIAGAQLAGMASPADFLAAAAVTFFSVNFIYSLNSWADIDIDRISKPFRPLPAGRIYPKHALAYCVLLFIISILFPFFIFSSPFPVFLCLLLPLLGLIYSLKPFRMRSKPHASLVIICLGLIIPLLTGYFSNSTDLSYVPLFIVMELYCLGVVPLKKIEELDEDQTTGNINLFELHGTNLISYACSMLFFALMILVISPLSLVEKIFSSGLILSTLLVIPLFKIFKIQLKFLYGTIIWMVILESVVFVLYMKVFT